MSIKNMERKQLHFENLAVVTGGNESYDVKGLPLRPASDVRELVIDPTNVNAPEIEISSEMEINNRYLKSKADKNII